MKQNKKNWDFINNKLIRLFRQINVVSDLKLSSRLKTPFGHGVLFWCRNVIRWWRKLRGEGRLILKWSLGAAAGQPAASWQAALSHSSNKTDRSDVHYQSSEKLAPGWLVRLERDNKKAVLSVWECQTSRSPRHSDQFCSLRFLQKFVLKSDDAWALR